MPRSEDHSLRAKLSELMHARTIPLFTAPAVVRSWLCLVSDDERAAETEWVNSLGTPVDGRLAETTPKGGMIWERHGEFSTWLQFSLALDPRAALREGLGFCSLRTEDFAWLEGAPGQVFRSVEIVVMAHEPKAAQFSGVIDLAQAVCCDVFDHKARIWSDFRAHEGGAGRIYVQDKGLKNDELSRLLQGLIEIGHYRKLALLGFPVARDLMGWLKDAEARLATVTADMAAQSASQEVLLERLMTLSAEVESRANAVRFRQGATEAYDRLTSDRLVSLRESRVEGHSTMQEFIERRLQPAMRTCEAASRRLDDLSVRLSRASDLLRARISISLEVQNQSLLKSMDLRARLQMKLSALVEGLSVFAVSYYVFNLVKYALDPLLAGHEKLAHFLYAPLIVAIIALAWLFITRRKKTIEGAAE
ncbi:DUF3422 domain-containing protein [Asticcacaulis sp. EMRT-3]|uniref:DUF3422 domain-containing protein n=1 Tax=Asticcacaulis sp. EMRT-3 TaxID=3040349 RepID=UPI0024AF66A5|nr:DUF3422 domain-containing protein [Asticcacaulis sp. EMRT-3]MDI7774175.1 DUF3422 domain-containing protein [Asticcacaulis sp. EMRT-3]